MADWLQEILLYDFYGELLTEKQMRCFELRYFQDYSLSEIAATYDVTPQAVMDLLRRTCKKLEFYETRLSLIQKHESMKARLNEIADTLRTVPDAHAALEKLDSFIRDM